MIETLDLIGKGMCIFLAAMVILVTGVTVAYLILNLGNKVDAVEVVRCKDCKYYHKADRGHPDTEWCKRLICGTIKPDFYCADGERKEE